MQLGGDTSENFLALTSLGACIPEAGCVESLFDSWRGGMGENALHADASRIVRPTVWRVASKATDDFSIGISVVLYPLARRPIAGPRDEGCPPHLRLELLDVLEDRVEVRRRWDFMPREPGLEEATCIRRPVLGGVHDKS